MKRTKRFGAALLLMVYVIAMFAMTGCGPKVLSQYDANANYIYIQAFTGGLGNQFLDYAITQFNTKYSGENGTEKWVVEILTTNTKDDGAKFYENFKANASTADIYYASNASMWEEMIQAGYLMDLSDVYNSKPDGENGLTVQEKLKDEDGLYNELFTADGKEGIYGIPGAELISGMVVDKEVFVSNGWFTAEAVENKAALESTLGYSLKSAVFKGKDVLVSAQQEGEVSYKDVILTPGKDGKYGTFDDGQPTTIEQWNYMIDAIAANGYKSFVWPGIAPEYTNCIIWSVFGQYMGEEDMYNWLSYGGNEYQYTTESGETVTVGKENAYDNYKNPALSKALQFFADNVPVNAYSKSLTNLDTHTDTQGYFVYGESSAKMEKVAILADGVWWENEARGKFASLESKGRGYGQVEYTFLLPPAFEGQKLAATDSWFVCSENGTMFAAATENKAKEEKIKEFLSMTLSDEALMYFTKQTGCPRPFTYEMTQDDLNEMTPFARNAWAVYTSENIHFGRNSLIYHTTNGIPLGNNSEWSSSIMTNGTLSNFVNPIQAMTKGYTVEQIVQGMYDYAKSVR